MHIARQLFLTYKSVHRDVSIAHLTVICPKIVGGGAGGRAIAGSMLKSGGHVLRMDVQEQWSSWKTMSMNPSSWPSPRDYTAACIDIYIPHTQQCLLSSFQPLTATRALGLTQHGTSPSSDALFHSRLLEVSDGGDLRWSPG